MGIVDDADITFIIHDDQLKLYGFDQDHGVPARQLTHLLGGKGAGLAEMTRALGFAVPPGFTIPLPVSERYLRERCLPEGFHVLLDAQLGQLGERMGRRFGDKKDPLLLAVRSGAPVSMPGMLDTVLNLGLNDETVEGLGATSGDPVFAWDCYRRFLRMFAASVLGLSDERLAVPRSDPVLQGLREEVARIRQRVIAETGDDVPHDPREQLRQTIVAVFESWNSDRAKAYRAREGIDDRMGTAVNVQAMVFGNRGSVSGTGVVFTRNPSTGAAELYGDYLPKAQGEDVVSGSAHTLPIARLADHAPAVFRELQIVLRRLELHYRDVCDVEFTVEDGRLWLLQTRPGKRSATAAVKIAVDLVNDPEVRLSRIEAVRRVPKQLRVRARQEILASADHAGGSAVPLAIGLGASPGRACGRIVLDSEAAIEATTDVILVRPQTSPEDVAGMSAAAGILTSTGGLVSHAAVVAREWGIPAVVGARDIAIIDGAVRVGDVVLREGDKITIDGSTGEVWRGEISPDVGALGEDETIRARLPELLQLEAWAAEHEEILP